MAKKKDIGTGFSAELKDAIDALNKTYGGGINMINDAPNMTIETISTGSLILDLALGGGWPTGKISEIFGDENIGKSSLCWHFLANCSGPKLYVDAEHSINKIYGSNIGADLNNLIIVQPDNIEMGLTVVRELQDKVQGIVFDSVAEAATQKELEGLLTDADIGVKARIMSKTVRVLKSQTEGATMIFVNQVRESPSITYGSNRVTPGGRALRFAAHVRLDLYGREFIKNSAGEPIAHYMNCKIVKQKNGPVGAKLQIPIWYDSYGISRETEIIDLCVLHGIIEKKGSWFAHAGSNLAQGQENLRIMLKDNLEYRDQLEKELKDKLSQ